MQADLLDPVNRWKDVVKGCRFVLHVACPWPSVEPMCEDDVLKPAVEGKLMFTKIGFIEWCMEFCSIVFLTY